MEAGRVERVAALLPTSPDPAVRAALFAAASSACEAPRSKDPSSHALLQAVLHADNVRPHIVEDVLRQLEVDRRAVEEKLQRAVKALKDAKAAKAAVKGRQGGQGGGRGRRGRQRARAQGGRAQDE